MTQKKNIIGAHMPPTAATAIVGTNGYQENGAAAKTLTGTTQATALQLGADVENVTGASNTGGLLPQSADVSDNLFIYNSGTNTVKIYPATAAGTINGGSAGAAFSLTTLTGQGFTQIGGVDNWATN